MGNPWFTDFLVWNQPEVSIPARRIVGSRDENADWLTDWPTDRLTDWRTDCHLLTEWLTDGPANGLTDQVTGWPIYWPIDRLTVCLIILLTYWPTDRLPDWLTDRPTELPFPSPLPREEPYRKLTEWMKKRSSEKMNVGLTDRPATDWGTDGRTDSWNWLVGTVGTSLVGLKKVGRLANTP